MKIRGLLATLLVLALSACGLPFSSTSSSSGGSSAGAPDKISDDLKPNGLQVHGDVSAEPDRIAVSAVASIQKFWTSEYPKTYGGSYQQLQGGLYAVRLSRGDQVPCSYGPREIKYNAFYCPKGDLVAWDSDQLLPDMARKYGDFAIPMILAHEWGHSIQARGGVSLPSVDLELQADCFSGSWVTYARSTGQYQVSDRTVSKAMAGLLSLSDPVGASQDEENAHGTGFDRVSAFQDGMDHGAGRCKAYREGDPGTTEMPFSSQSEEESGGNMPYDQQVKEAPLDLEDYWSHTFPTLASGGSWQAMSKVQAFDPSAPPTCDGQSIGQVMATFCPADRTIYYDNSNGLPRIYNTDGDSAVVTVFARLYGYSALDQLHDSSKGKLRSLRAICLAGAYQRSLYGESDRNRKYTASPGDLDESTKAILSSDTDAVDYGTGIEQLRSFRAGFLDGPKSCL